MKPDTRNAYARRVDAVLARLQQAIAAGADLPGLDELAAVAHLSPFHFHRVWRALTGEPLGGTVARLRLARALQLLGDAEAGVAEVALAVGYDTPQALARAMRERLDASPSELRDDPARRAALLARLGRPTRAVGDPLPLQVEVVSLEPFEVVALRNRGAFADLDQAYGALFDWAAGAGVVESIIGLHGIPWGDHRDLPAETLEFDCAIRLDGELAAEPEMPLRRETLAGGLFARLRHVGPYEGLEDAVDGVLADWLPGSGHVLRAAPIRYDFLDDPETVPAPLLRADILVPLAG
ncbi:AraC family transcriptional regulator [Thermomonas mangrovi]|uniref:AraC family transcriptional regulator n=1 Tax=Thermomonas mangrovi TaxID=2993316 RepID=UPI0023083646|nr:AraC family transcriptional regulator [Thermomonas mangrovi]